MGIKDELIAQCQPDQHVIGFENGKYWEYRLLSTAELVQKIQETPEVAKHESIHRPCKLYFDLDGIAVENGQFNPAEYKSNFEKRVAQEILSDVPSAVNTKPVWFQRASFRDKISYHVIYPDIWIANRQDISGYAQRLKLPEIDHQVYRTGMMRLPFSCKPGGNPDTKFICEGISFSPETFLRGVICHGEPGYLLEPLNLPSSSRAITLPENCRHRDHVSRLIAWFKDFWLMDFRVASIKLHPNIPNYYSVHNSRETFCKIAGRVHKGNKSYFHFQFMDEINCVAVYVFCTDQDCMRKWQFTDIDLSPIAYSTQLNS